MTSRSISSISSVSDELNRRQTIPVSYQETLEQRLAIVFKPVERQTRETTPRPIRDIRSHYKRKKAQRTYLDILDEDPHAFLPFILVVSPKACERFVVSSFYQGRGKQSRIHLKPQVMTFFRGIAEAHKFSHSRHYKRWIEILFRTEEDLPPPQTTTARCNTYWEYHGAHLDIIRIVFGDGFSELVESTPERQREKMDPQIPQRTTCMTMNIPKLNFEDAFICINVGPARELARILFPQASHMGILYTENPENDQEKNDIKSTFKGASSQAIALIFARRIREAIKSSNLRTKEEEGLRSDITDCIRMELSDNEGTLYLQIGFIDSLRIAKELF